MFNVILTFVQKGLKMNTYKVWRLWGVYETEIFNTNGGHVKFPGLNKFLGQWAEKTCPGFCTNDPIS